MRNFLRFLLIILTAIATQSGCGVDVVRTGEDERGPVVEPIIVTKTADVVVVGDPVENDFASCEWLKIETFPEQVVGHCKWKPGCDEQAALPLPDIAPAPMSVVATNAGKPLSGLTFDDARQELVLASGACPKAGAVIEVRYTNAVHAQMADRPQFVYGEKAFGCGFAEVQMRSALPLETGAKAETLSVGLDLDALGIDYPKTEPLAQDVVREFDLTEGGPVHAAIQRLSVGTPERLFSDFCADKQTDDAILLATWVAVAGKVRITVHTELIASSQFLLSVELEGAVFRLQGQDVLSNSANIHLHAIKVGMP